MVDSVANAYDAMIEKLLDAHKGTAGGGIQRNNAENRINNLRNDLRDAEIDDTENNTNNYQTCVYYIDILNSLERMGDFIINISQDLEKTFVRK